VILTIDWHLELNDGGHVGCRNVVCVRLTCFFDTSLHHFLVDAMLTVLQSRLSQAELRELFDKYASYNEGKGDA